MPSEATKRRHGGVARVRTIRRRGKLYLLYVMRDGTTFVHERRKGR